MKVCSKCGTEKPESEFYKTKRYGLEARCKRCCCDFQKEYRNRFPRHEWALKKRTAKNKRKYGLTDTQFENMLATQEYACAVCRATIAGPCEGSIATAYIDHDHATGAVRSLLCHKCNTWLVPFESPLHDRLEAYLAFHKTKEQQVADYRDVCSGWFADSVRDQASDIHRELLAEAR